MRRRSLVSLTSAVLLVSAVLVPFSSALVSPVSAEQAKSVSEKIPVKTADDLPRRTVRIEGTALEFLKNEKAFNAMLAELVKNANADLTKYDIQDPTTLIAYYRFLQTAAQLKHDPATAMEFVPLIKALEPKEADKLMAGITLEAMIAAEKAAGGHYHGAKTDKATYVKVMQAKIRERVSPLPYDVIKDRLIAVRNSSKMATRTLVEAGLTNQLDPVLKANNGEISDQIAVSLAQTKYVLDVGLDLLPKIGEVYSEIIDAQSRKATPVDDRWTPRLVTLPADAKATPVVVAVWDTGVDTSFFPGRVYEDPKEPGKHGLAFDLAHKPTTSDTQPLSELKGDKAKLIEFIGASMDASAGLETPAVEALRAYVRSLPADKIQAFQEDMSLLGNWSHGTHVAGIVADGNPFVRLAYMRETFDYKSLPDTAPTIEEYKAWGEQAEAAIAYFKKANVRVVNMSWRIPAGAVEGLLEAKGVGGSKEERAALGKKIFAEFKTRLENAMRGAPEILFVAGSGNESNDVDFSEYVPAGLKMPNLLTIGAIDSADKPTSFTSFGKGVELYANGFQIESYLPGGQRMRFSGTSMASPQVANLAGKLLALNPKLTVAEVIELIRSSAEPLPNYPGRLIINPKAAVAKATASK